MKCFLWLREKKNKDWKLFLRLSGGKEKMWQALECVAGMTEDPEKEK